MCKSIELNLNIFKLDLFINMSNWDWCLIYLINEPKINFKLSSFYKWVEFNDE